MLDFLPFKKAQAAVNAVGNAGCQQRVFEYARLGVGAVEQGNLAQCRAVAVQGVDFAGNPLRFFVVTHGLEDAQRLARAPVGPQVFAQPVAVVFDDGVGSVQNVAARAVVLFQPDEVGVGKFAFKIMHVAHIRAAKAVDGLVIIANAEKARLLARKQLQPAVLQDVGVLKFVDQNVRKAHLVVLAQRLVVGEQLKAAQQQFGKIDHAFALALRVVFRKEFQAAAFPV